MNQQISPNFTLSELCHSNTAEARGMLNKPSQAEIDNLTILARELLQPLRELYGKPIVINSGYRSPEVNKAVGGVSNSQHMLGEAVDISVDNPRELLHCLADSGLIFDQAILYDDGRNKFLHISYTRHRNRKQVLFSKNTEK